MPAARLAVPGGGADTGTPMKRANSGPAVMGAESHRVVIDAATMKSPIQTAKSRQARRSNGKHQQCASGFSATKALPTSSLPPRQLLALVTFAPLFVRTPIRQTTCTLATRRTHSLRLRGTRSTARRLRQGCDSQRVAVRHRRPPRLSSVGQAKTPSSQLPRHQSVQLRYCRRTWPTWRSAQRGVERNGDKRN